MPEIALPLSVDSLGRIRTVSDTIAVARQHLTSYVTTATGERVMRPNFGVPLRDAIFDQLETTTAELLRQRASAAIDRDVPNVIVNNLIFAPGAQEGELDVNVAFSVPLGSVGATPISTVSMTIGV